MSPGPVPADGIDLALMAAWAGARSLSRGLPMPVIDRGGVRVDSGLPDERRRHIFVAPCERLRELGETIAEPFVPLKLCGPMGELLSLLPPRWRAASESWVMDRPERPRDAPELPVGYALSLATNGAVTAATIVGGDGRTAATGFAAEHDGVFIYDRIRVEEAHRRRGLRRALMATLATARRDPRSREVLTATAEGRALYHGIGWRDLAPYSTAVIPTG